MFPQVSEDVHMVEVAVDGVQVLQDRKTMKTIQVNINQPIQEENMKERKYEEIYFHTQYGKTLTP